jgi:hypothetical protein
MKKLIIFLISITLLTFSNTASASFFEGFFKTLFGDMEKPTDIFSKSTDVNNVKCKVEYTQLNLATGLEKNIKHTVKYNLIELDDKDDVMYLSAQDITDKINIWLNESENNIITNLTIINCKESRFYISIAVWESEDRWSEYKGCKDEYNIKLIDWLEHPNQWGYNVHKDRLIKDYEDGCKNRYSQFK